MERFDYDPGVDNFPDVYIRDHATGVQFELEDMEELREGAVLSLDIERESCVNSHMRDTDCSAGSGQTTCGSEIRVDHGRNEAGAQGDEDGFGSVA